MYTNLSKIIYGQELKSWVLTLFFYLHRLYETLKNKL